MAQLTLRDVPGIGVGHVTDPVGITGCTVVLTTGGAVAGVDVRGSAPGTRETDLLRPTALVQRVHALCLAGGSAFGLAAADGVMRWLEERGIGFATPAGPVPIVPAAILYDLGLGSAAARPTAASGYAACAAAERGDGPLEGSVGAGTGATVAKLAGPDAAVKGGIGSAGRGLADGRIVAALAVTNSVGNIVGADGRLIAAPQRDVRSAPPAAPFENTTLGVVATDAPLDRAQCAKLAELGHDAMARAITPAHTMFDGDVVFALSTGNEPVLDLERFTSLAMAAEEALRAAIERSVLRATALGGVPAAWG